MVRLSGAIDTQFPRANLLQLARGVVVFDLDEVKKITSYGVREWIKAMKELACDYYCFVRCRPSIIMQFNMMSQFAGRGELLSFYLPYVCGGCGEYTDVLLDMRTQFNEVRTKSPPPVKCPKCQADADFDDSPGSYFSYASRCRQPAPPALVDALLAGKQETAEPLSVAKDVEDSVTALWLSGSLDKTASFKRIADGLEGSVVAVLEGITRVSDPGMERLRSLLNTGGLELYLARVPPELANALAADPKGTCGAKLVSGWLPFRCGGCGAQGPLELGAEELTDLALDRPAAGACELCHGALQPAFSPQELAALRALRPQSAPTQVKEYLRTHRSFADSSQAAPAPNEAFGRYQLVRRLGMGGMAEVFLARQTAVAGFEKKVVLKRILPHLSEDTAFINMFLDEARLAARISHPNVTQIFDLGQEGNQYFMAMEYVPGWDLNVVLKQCAKLKQPLPVHLAARVAADICAGLQAAHSCTDESGAPLAIIHRDVSPHNVLVSGGGQVKLTDFGIAKAVDNSSRTPVNTIKGKMSYMAPEQGAGTNTPLDGRADLFPTGLIFYQCLTLEHLFQRDSDFATLNAIMTAPIPRMAEKLPQAPPLVQEILDRALARDREQRYPTALAFQEDLERLIASTGQPASAADLSKWLAPRMAELEASGPPLGGGTRTFLRTPSNGP